MTRRRFTALVAAPIVAGALLTAGVSGATAAPSQNASCVAKLTYLWGPNQGAGGDLISYVAHLPKDYCYFGG